MQNKFSGETNILRLIRSVDAFSNEPCYVVCSSQSLFLQCLTDNRDIIVGEYKHDGIKNWFSSSATKQCISYDFQNNAADMV